MFRKRLFRTLVIGVSIVLVTGAMASEPKVLNVYNWTDYIDPAVLKQFEKETGIKVNYEVYDGNDVLEGKLVAGNSGYDVVFPSMRPYAQRHIRYRMYLPLDRKLLPNYRYVDKNLLKQIADADPGNRYVIPYLWGTTGLGINIKKVRAVLGKRAPLNSWKLLFDKNNARKLAKCGIAILDDDIEIIGAVLISLGMDPNNHSDAAFNKVRSVMKSIRPHIRYFSSSRYVNDLATGKLCVVIGYSGDVLQAREKAGKGMDIRYIIPKEGAMMYTDVMAIPSDAPHKANALKFVNFLLRPDIIARISNKVAYANANTGAIKYMNKSIISNPAIYPPVALRLRLKTSTWQKQVRVKARKRLWEKVTANPTVSPPGR